MRSPATVRTQQTSGQLHLHWPDGVTLSLNHASLRAACPCSQCRAMRLRGKIDLVNGNVRILAINPQGYGLQLVFNDGHERGIYPWEYLRQLAGSP